MNATAARSTATIADLVEVGLLKARQQVSGVYRGFKIVATVTAAGRLSVKLPNGGYDLYSSPSGAVRAALAANVEDAPSLIPGGSGWTFWHDSRGRTLGELRDLLAA